MNIIAILVELIPALVSLAEKLLPSAAGSAKKDWVVGMVHSLVGFVQSKSPDSVKPVEQALEPLIDALIEAAVAKLP